jgi:predicted SAM-dependent methyltransferase
MKKLDIGCGISKRKGFIGVDKIALPGVDIVHDLDVFPYPFDDDEVTFIWMNHVLEHLMYPVKTIEEIYRICKIGARVVITTPYFRSYLATVDPTHKSFFGLGWFNYFDPEHEFFKKYQYSIARFKIEKIELDRDVEINRRGILQPMFLKIAKNHPGFYEEKLSHLYPFQTITYCLRKV